MALGVHTQVCGDVFILRCDGRIVFGDEGAVLRERVGNMLSGSPKIVVNLTGVNYIDSGGLGILVGLSVSARNRGGELKLVSPSKRVNDLLQRTNLDTILRVYGNDEEAVAAFRKTSSLRDRQQIRKTS
ncbi:MAG TPA: STAS domain-containing protein [Nitrososphaera sp.]|nr:STAS domain-containing protein [Nitrososphaera sp.]